ADPAPRPHQRALLGPPRAADRPHRGHHRRGRTMRLALRELRRQPNRFAVATLILTLIAVLLMFLGGLLDGLLAGSTGALRQQDADMVVYATGSEASTVRSRIGPEVRDQVTDA